MNTCIFIAQINVNLLLRHYINFNKLCFFFRAKRLLAVFNGVPLRAKKGARASAVQSLWQ